MTDKDKNIFFKFGLWLVFLLLLIILGISNVFADEILDTSTWVNVTGREWSLSPQEYTYNKTVTNDWVYNYYNITGGIYTPPSSFDYITFSFFQRSGYTYKPCGNEKFNASFKLQLSNSYFSPYVSGIKWNDDSCAYTTSNNTTYDVNCIVNPSSGSLNSIKMYFDEISGTYTSTLAISRNINVSCNINTQAIIDNASQNAQNIINNNNTNTQNIMDSNASNTQSIMDSNASNTQSIMDNNNQNKQDIIDNQNKLNKDTYYTCEDITPQYVTTLNGLISVVDNNLRLVNDTQNRKVVVYKFPKLSYTYTFTFNNYNRIRIGSSDTLYTQQQLQNTPFYLLYPIMVNDTPAISNDYDIYSDHEYVYFYLSSDASVDGSITFKPDESCINKLDEAEATRKGIFARLGELISTLFSTDDADISGLDNMAGWLPAGPLDSIINLPLNLFNSLTNVLSGTCSSVSLTLPFVNKQLILPCFDTFMSQYLPGFSTVWTFIGVTVSVFILYNYLLALFKWVEDTLTLRENTLPGYYEDRWGGGA